jgi:hypothetical protein
MGTGVGIILEKVRARRLALDIARREPEVTPVVVYFGDAPGSLYQLRRWYSTLAALDRVHPTAIITSDSSTYAAVRRETQLPVTFANGAPQLARVLERQQARVVLYANHNALNFRVLRFATPVHVFIGHGESGKESSVSRQLKAYDLDFVADRESIEQLRAIRGYDADASAVVVGSPWLGFLGAPPTAWRPDGRRVVLYAPTWEGDRPSMDYSSVESLGDEIVSAVLGAPDLRLVYRPHPWLGRVRPASAEADARLRRAITASNRGGFVDSGEYGWALDAADACVTDVSSVAHDIRALGKPLLLTAPTSASVPPVAESAFTGAVRVDAADAEGIRGLIGRALADGASRPRATSTSMDAFLDGIAAALRLGGNPTL